MKKLLVILALIGFSLNFAYADKLKVVASFSILGDWVKEIGGNRVKIENLVGFNQDSHDYEITASDKVKLKSAGLILIQGLDFESSQVAQAIKFHSDKVLVVSSVFATEDLIPLIKHRFSDREMEKIKAEKVKSFDPHTWSDISLAKKSVLAIRDHLIGKNPSNRKYYTKRSDAYLKQLDELSEWADSKFSNIDRENVIFITIHPGFQYLAKKYQLNYLSLESAGHHHGEISAKQVSRVMESITKWQEPYIFTEKDSDIRIAQMISKKTNSKIIGELYSDFLTDDQGEAPSYLALMKHNIDKITSYLDRK